VLVARNAVTSPPVVTSVGKIRGVVSEADLARESVPRDPRMSATPLPSGISPPRFVNEAFTPHAITVRKHDDLARAVDLMTSTGAKSLPVVDESDRVVGVVARSDVVRVLARTDQAIEAEIDEMMRELGHPDRLVDVTDGAVEVSRAGQQGRTVPGGRGRPHGARSRRRTDPLTASLPLGPWSGRLGTSAPTLLARQDATLIATRGGQP
jgi:hypothetical protein